MNVVASYPADAELMRTLFEMPCRPDVLPGVPYWETTAIWSIQNDASVPPLRQTLTAAYDVEGRDESEAEQFARAIFAMESRSASLPEPETVVAHAE